MFWEENILVRYSDQTLWLELIVYGRPHLRYPAFLHSFQTLVHFSLLSVYIWEAPLGLNFSLFRDLKLALWPWNFFHPYLHPNFCLYQHHLCLYLEVVQISTTEFGRDTVAYIFVHSCRSANTHVFDTCARGGLTLCFQASFEFNLSSSFRISLSATLQNIRNIEQ